MKRAILLLPLLLAIASCKRDPSGEEMLGWSMDQYAALKSYRAAGLWQAVIGGRASEPTDRIVIYQAPNKFKILSGDPDALAMISVSDGKGLAEFSSDPLRTPIGVQAPASLALASTPYLEEPRASGSLLYKMFAGRKALDQIVDRTKGDIKLGPVQLMPDDTKVREISFFAKGPYGKTSILIDPKTGMVHRIQFDGGPLIQEFLASDRGKEMDEKTKEAYQTHQFTEEYTEVVINPDLAKEKFEGKVPASILASHERATAGPRMIGKQAPDFTLKGPDGKRVKLSSLRGRPVLLDFWATYCVPCKISLPHTQRVAQKYGSKAVVMAVNAEKPETASSFLKDMKLSTLPVYRDDKHEVGDMFFVDTLPSFVMIDEKGKIVDYVIGYNEKMLDEGLKKIGLQ